LKINKLRSWSSIYASKETCNRNPLGWWDPDETLRIRNLLGFLDGQTTNPTFVSNNPDVQRRIASGHKLSWEEQKQEYKDIVSKISPLVGSARVSIEVFADFDSTSEQMLDQGE